jgi:hypothetical protein
MNANLPKYMPIGDFCKYSGFSRYQFMRLADKASIKIIPLTADRRSKMVDVQAALAAIEALPDADKEVPVNLQTAPNGAVEDVAESTSAAE